MENEQEKLQSKKLLERLKKIRTNKNLSKKLQIICDAIDMEWIDNSMQNCQIKNQVMFQLEIIIEKTKGELII